MGEGEEGKVVEEILSNQGEAVVALLLQHRPRPALYGAVLGLLASTSTITAGCKTNVLKR